MSREVLSTRDYQYSNNGYLVDNIPWQEEIRRRVEEERKSKITETHPTLSTEDFQPAFLPENAEAFEPEKPVEPTVEELVAKALEEAQAEARSIVQAAKKSSFEIIEQGRWDANDLITKAKEEAEKEIQKIKEGAAQQGQQEGFEKGHAEGLEIGKIEGRESYGLAIKKWDKLVEELAPERKRTLEEMKPILVELVGEALNQCLKKEAKRHGQMVVEFSHNAIKNAQDMVHLKLRLNPEDIEEIESQKEALQLSVGAGNLELVADERIERGGCLLETEAGSVDVRIPTVVSRVKESLASEILPSNTREGGKN